MSEFRVLISQIFKYLGTGLLSNTVNYSTFFVVLRFLKVNYLISSTCGFFSGFFSGFFINRSWTFMAHKGTDVRKQLVKYFIVVIISLLANLATLKFFTKTIGIIPEISQVIAIGVSTVINFTCFKFWVFGGG